MKYKILFLLLIGISLQFPGCEKPPEDSAVETIEFENTLGTSLSGDQGSIDDYFYNFGESPDIQAEFFRYNPNLMKNYDSYSAYYGLFGEDPPTMDYRTFPQHLVAMTPADEAEFTERHYIDSLSVQDSIVFDSVEINSSKFKNLEALEWNLEAEPSLQRYKLVNSDWVSADTLLFFSDTFNVNAYWAVIDTPFIDEGLMFVDSSEWNDTNYVFLADDRIRFLTTFEFTKKQLSSDSLVFRINTDCNDNGQWDGAESPIEDYNGDGVYELLYEYDDQNNNGVYDAGDAIIQDYNGDDTISVAYEFVDAGNNVWDPEEPYYDADDNGQYDLNDPYQDRNCNEKWDGAEEYADADGSGSYTEGEEFTDRGNDIFDSDEEFTLNYVSGDTIKSLYIIGEKPDNLIVDWIDSDNPEVMLEVGLGDDITDRWGTAYTDLIEEVDFTDLKQQYVDDIDSLVTLYTREKVGHISGSNLSPDDYHITKSEWTRTSGGEIERFYNYHIFHEPKHLNQVVYPAYFLPVGFYFNPNDIQDGFWHKSQLESEVLYFTSDGLLRDGERVDTAYYDTTAIAVYFIEKSFTVESSSVTVPAGYRSSDSESAVDTTFADCFKVTNKTTMTMVGSGVDYGQKTESWLAKGSGLVKSEIHIRWTEHPYDPDNTSNGPPDENNEAWVGLNRIELKSLEMTDNGNVFRILTQPVQIIELKDIGNNAEFNFDPFRVSTQTGIQTIDLREMSE